MAEIFVVNNSSALAGQYVSDLPVVNETPVSRQIGFYLSDVASSYEATLSAYLTDTAAVFGVDAADADAGAAAIIGLIGGAITEAEINTAFGVGGDVLNGTASIEEIIRILVGTDSAFTETGIVGNHRLIGGKRRIYLRDRVEASLGEGFLRTFSDAGDLVIYLADGTVL